MSRMNSNAYRNSMSRFVEPKMYRADAVFPPPKNGEFERTQAFSFTGEKGVLELKLLKPVRNVTKIELTSLFMVNPYISISNVNCCLSYDVVTAASGATPLATGSPVTHYIVLETGDFDPVELVEKLNTAFFHRHQHHDFRFNYDAKETHKLTLTNTHATQTLYIPSKSTIDTHMSATPIDNAVGSLWATLGFALNTRAVELRATDARSANDGMNSVLPALPTEMSNFSDISFLIADDVPANNYSAVTANYVAAHPMSLSGKSELLAEQFLLFNNPFSMSKSKKCLYLVASSIDTNHDLVSCSGTTQQVRRRRTVTSGTVVNGVKTNRPMNVEEKSTAYAPVESAVNIEGVLAVIPVVSGQVDLVNYSTKSIDLSKNPISNFKNLKLQIISDNNEVVDMRGRSISATITCTLMY